MTAHLSRHVRHGKTDHGMHCWRICFQNNQCVRFIWGHHSQHAFTLHGTANKAAAWGRSLQKPSKEGWITVYWRLHLWPTGERESTLKKDVLSFNFACRVCEMGPLFVRVFGEFYEVTHMWLIKTAPCDLWRCSERFCGCPPPPLSLLLYLYQIQSFKHSRFWWNWWEWGARWLKTWFTLIKGPSINVYIYTNSRTNFNIPEWAHTCYSCFSKTGQRFC